jgi:hypothetical protein
MTDTGSHLRCPECDGPITGDQLATFGLCADCNDRVAESMPDPLTPTPPVPADDDAPPAQADTETSARP